MNDIDLIDFAQREQTNAIQLQIWDDNEISLHFSRVILYSDKYEIISLKCHGPHGFYGTFVGFWALYKALKKNLLIQVWYDRFSVLFVQRLSRHVIYDS